MSKIKFSDSEWDHMHDVVFDADNKNLSQKELVLLYSKLPEHIQKDAVRWGLNDSVVRDDIYVWIKNNDISKIIDND